MTAWKYALFAALILISGCCQPERTTGISHERSVELEKELIDTDRAFARAAAERGIDGWISYFADDAVRMDLHGDTIRGIDTIRANDNAMFSDPETELRWEPGEAGIFKDGTHGYTRGTYWLVMKESPQQILSQGRYLTIWRQNNGKWKVILDTGSAESKKQAE